MDQKAPSQIATPVGGAFRVLASKPAWVAIGVLLLNDLHLKYAFPAAVTGKLSDIAELFVLPWAAAAVVLVFTARFPRLAIPLTLGVYTAVSISAVTSNWGAQAAAQNGLYEFERRFAEAAIT